jgi:hypothetical protein
MLAYEEREKKIGKEKITLGERARTSKIQKVYPCIK